MNQIKSIYFKGMYQLEVIQGFFDADGSFEAKVYLGKRKTISFHVNILFSQKEKDVLEAVLFSINSQNQINERTITNASGTISTGNSIGNSLSSDSGQLLLDFWEKNPPKAPTKYLDYRIAKIIYKVAQDLNTTSLDVVNELLPELNLQSERVASLALLYLRFQMYGKIKDNSNPELYKITYYYKKVSATKDEIAQGETIGKQLFEPIQQDYEICKSNFNMDISNNYLLGYHIGDGSFWVSNKFPNKRSFRSTFYWSLTDCTDNRALLKSIKNKLISENVPFPKPQQRKESAKTKKLKEYAEPGISDYTTYLKLQLSSKEACGKLLELFSKCDFDFQNLPEKRLNQYTLFVKAYNMYFSPNFRKNLSVLQEFIRITWQINPTKESASNSSEQEELEKVAIYYNNKRN